MEDHVADDITHQQIMDRLDEQDKRFEQHTSNLAEVLTVITDNMVTKDDLKRFATKDDLKRFATKADLAAATAASKDDLAAATTATKADLAELRVDIQRLDRKVDRYHRANIQHHLGAREEIGRLNSQLQTRP